MPLGAVKEATPPESRAGPGVLIFFIKNISEYKTKDNSEQ
jgi:hypothetical protein